MDSGSQSDAAEQGRAEPLASGLNFFQRALCAVVATGPVPKHVAFIMDGNRRFARQRGWIVADGHRLGYDKLEEALRWCCELGVVAVTVFAFSIENFKREPEEVDALMALCEEKLRRMCDEEHMVQRRGVRVRVVGDLGRLTPSLRAEMQNVMRLTQDNTQALLNVCFSYTSRNEIATATGHLAAACTQVRDSPDSDPRPYPDTGQARALALALALALTVTLTLALTLALTLTLALALAPTLTLP